MTARLSAAEKASAAGRRAAAPISGSRYPPTLMATMPPSVMKMPAISEATM